jgi:hypothetical protein
MSMYDLLHIYDSGVNALIRIGFKNRSADYTLDVSATGTKHKDVLMWSPVGTLKLPEELDVGGTKALVDALDDLVKKGHSFRRVVFSTHGSPGAIWIGDEAIDATVLNTLFASRNYHRLFPLFSRMYFSGCHVAAGNNGDMFLEAVGRIFLASKGGVAFGWDSYGLALPWGEEHIFGTAKYVSFAPGGTVVDRYTGLDEFKRKHPDAWFLQ